MTIKSPNVTAIVDPVIKEKAEAILSDLGITASRGIKMFYRQIILCNGLPFRPSIPVNLSVSLDEMIKEEFDEKMAVGLKLAKAGEGISAEKYFDALTNEITKSCV